MAKKQAILHLTLFYVISILLLLFSYYSMLHAAAELYGLGTGNNIFNVIIRVFIIVSSLICLVINQFRIKSTALNNIVVLWVIWMLIAGFVRPEKYFSNMTNVLFWPALYFLFYYFSRNLINRRRVLYLILFVFIEVSLFYYVVTQDKN